MFPINLLNVPRKRVVRFRLFPAQIVPSILFLYRQNLPIRRWTISVQQHITQENSKLVLEKKEEYFERRKGSSDVISNVQERPNGLDGRLQRVSNSKLHDVNA